MYSNNYSYQTNMQPDYETYSQGMQPGYSTYSQGVQPSYSTYSQSIQPGYSTTTDKNDDRFLGAGLVAPFLLGGLAGAAISPYFNRPYCCGYYPPQPYPPQPYPPQPYPPYYPYSRY